MHYLITFIGHIDERKRPENFPRQIIEQLIVEAETKDQIVSAVNDYSMKYIKVQGMSVKRDPAGVTDVAKIDTDRMFVPMHMITYIEAKHQIVITPAPELLVGRPLLTDGQAPIQ